MPGSVCLDKIRHSATVAHEGPVRHLEPPHSFGPAEAPPTQRLLRKLAKEPAPRDPPAFGFDVNRPEQVVGERNHDLGHFSEYTRYCSLELRL